MILGGSPSESRLAGQLRILSTSQAPALPHETIEMTIAEIEISMILKDLACFIESGTLPRLAKF